MSELSKNEAVFNEAATQYQRGLNDAGYNYKLKFSPPDQNPKRIHQRSRNITWFNPPFSKNISTNIGKEFFNLLSKCFPPRHILNPIINKNTVKLSYSCLPNMGTVISSKNKKLLLEGQNLPPPCTCEQDQCPVDGKCTQKNVIYQATLEAQNNEIYKYIGLTEKSFFQRWTQHNSSFRVHDPRNSTSLSRKILELQRKHILFDLKWKILDKTTSYTPGSEDCRLCISEIYFIIFFPADASLNSRQEFFNLCRHKSIFKLSNIK